MVVLSRFRRASEPHWIRRQVPYRFGAIRCRVESGAVSCLHHLERRHAMSSPLDRREFLAAGTAALVTESSRGFAANDTLQVGLIGVGGRCKHLLRSFPQLPNVKITAVCDVWDQNLAEAKKLADPKAFATKHSEEL